MHLAHPQIPRFLRPVMTGWVICVLLVGWTESIKAQGPLTRSAIALAEAGQLEDAEYKLAAAMAGPEAQDAMTWYVHAFVLKERYIAEGRRPESNLRQQSLASAKACIQRDSNGELSRWTTPLLEFLAESHLDDVKAAISASSPDSPPSALNQFAAYSDVQAVLTPNWNEDAEWVLMNQQIGEKAMREAERLEKMGAGPWFAMGVHHYSIAAQRTTDQERSLFNLAVHTYNQGVREFKAAEDDLDAVDAALRQAAEHWQKASDLLDATIEKEPENPKAYEALAIVSTALLNQDRINWCKDHIRELRGGE